MVKEKEKEREKEQKERKMFIGVVWNCAAELKLLLTALLFLCSIITIFQFLPSRLSFSVSDLRHCVSSTTPADPDSPIFAINYRQTHRHCRRRSPNKILSSRVASSSKPSMGTAQRRIILSAYIGGLDTFTIDALASKPLHVFSKLLEAVDANKDVSIEVGDEVGIRTLATSPSLFTS